MFQICCFFEFKQIFADLTEIDKALCKNDEDCQKANFHEVGGNPADMVCVSHYGTVETILQGNQMVVQTKLNETEYGKCTLGKISQITL